MSQPVAVIMSEVFLRRLTPALAKFAGRAQDYRILSIHREIGELENLISQIKPAGLILEILPNRSQELLMLAKLAPTILVATDERVDGCISVDVDDWAVGKEAAEAFSNAGFRSLACLGNGTPYSEQRIDGFTQVAGKLEIPIFTHSETGFEDARYSESFRKPSPEMEDWLNTLPKPTAIFAVHDPLGRFLCGACGQLGLEVPNDVAIIGANDDPLVCNLTFPTLSSIAIPWEALGERVGLAMDGILNQQRLDPAPILIPPSGTVLRHSANHLAVEDPILRRAMSYLTEKMQHPLSISSMCGDLRIARRTLERRFKEYFQHTPWEMLCRMRVNQARRLLAETNYS
ncbi:MAG: substrate-binding domain-containing protein, partial [Opitutae bacterium]